MKTNKTKRNKTIVIQNEIHHPLKLQAVKNNVSIQELIERYIQEGIERDGK